MKKTLLLTTLAAATALPASAAVFHWTDFPDTVFADNQTSVQASVDGVQATVSTSTGVIHINGESPEVAFRNHIGVVDSSAGLNATTDFTGTNLNQGSRIGTGQLLSISFDTDVILNSITTNNWLGSETVLITTSGSALTGLSGYDTVDGTGQNGTLTSFGYTGSSFELTTDNANGSIAPTYLFSGDEGTDIYLSAGDTITFGTGGPDSPGWGLNGFEVTQVPEPSSTALLGLAGLALILRRRR